MNAKTNTLRLTFKNSEGKKTNLTITNPAQLDETAIKAEMGSIAQADIFEKEGVILYQEPQSASYVERTVNTVFTVDGDAEAKQDQSRTSTWDHGLSAENSQKVQKTSMKNITKNVTIEKCL